MPANAAYAIACFAGISNIKVDIGVTSVEGIQLAVNGLNLNIGPNLILLSPELIDTGPLMNVPPCLSVVTDIGPDAILANAVPASRNEVESIESLIMLILH